jgi:hypothetical protein
MTRQRVTDQPLDPMPSGDGILDALILCRNEIVGPCWEPVWAAKGRGT